MRAGLCFTAAAALGVRILRRNRLQTYLSMGTNAENMSDGRTGMGTPPQFRVRGLQGEATSWLLSISGLISQEEGKKGRQLANLEI